jgi:hypothetical protein
MRQAGVSNGLALADRSDLRLSILGRKILKICKKVLIPQKYDDSINAVNKIVLVSLLNVQ